MKSTVWTFREYCSFQRGTCKWSSLFDPEGLKKVQTEGFTDRTLQQVKVPMPELIAAGLLGTQLIATKHKLNFLFGLVDCDDTGWLTEEQMGTYIKAFVRGVGMMFDVPHEILPRNADSLRVAQRLFERIHRVIAAIGKGEEAEKAREGVRDGISAETLINWVYGDFSEEDPLALPYRLAIARFCPSRNKDLTDEYDDSFGEFAISHSERVEIPPIPVTPVGCKLLTRAEVIMARDLYRYAMDSGIMRVGDRTFDKFIQLRGTTIHPGRRDWYLNGLSKIADDMRMEDGRVVKPDFFAYLRKLQPHALPKHLRMYDVWCMEYDELKKEEEVMETVESAASQFVETAKKPFLPADEVEILRKQFYELDVTRDGFLDLDDIQRGWGWSDEQIRDALKTFDVGCDGMLDEDEFLRMMCPPEYRLPEMSGFAREMFGKLIVEEQKARRGLLSKRKGSFLGEDSGDDGPAPAPASALPVVPEDLLESWGDIFDALDQDDDEMVYVRDLETSGLLSTGVCYFIAGLIDPSNPEGFDRDAFLNAMCKSHGYSRAFKV